MFKVIFVAKKIKLLLLIFVILSGFGTSSDSDRQKKTVLGPKMSANDCFVADVPEYV